MVYVFGRKIIRQICGHVKYDETWRMRYITVLYKLYNEVFTLKDFNGMAMCNAWEMNAYQGKF